MYWYWINVFYNGRFVGSFYTDKSNRSEVSSEINVKYGEGKWSSFTSE